MRKAGQVTVASAASVAALRSMPVFAATRPATISADESAVGRFYQSLSDAQKKKIHFAYGHQLRQRINANWHVTDIQIDDDFFSDKQRALITEIVKGATSEDGYGRLLKQMEDDDGGMGAYSVAVFGEPGTDQFEFTMTGRHLTLRANGNRNDQIAFGGPLVYGHGEEQTKANLFHYQTQQANEVFRALDADQAKKALLKQAPRETAVALQGAKGKFNGLAVSEMSSDQQELVEKTLKVLMAPYSQQDVQEALAVIKAAGGLSKLHMAFYQQGDLNSDKTWDIWRLEGPSMVWHFRGAPHVHAYINIGVVSST